MTIPVVDPTSVNFGAIVPGTTKGSEITINSAPSNSKITAKIIDNPLTFSVFSVTSWEWRWEPVDPGELPPGHKGPPPKHRVLEQVGQSNGVEPFAVSSAQLIKIMVDATLPHTSQKAGTEFLGTLLIKGEGWDTVSVKLFAVLAPVKHKPSA